MNSQIKIETLERLQKGDQKAFDRVFIAFYSRIKVFIRAIIKSEADAEDLAQDIFAKLWINRQEISLQKPFNAYIYTIARNTAFNYLKHKIVNDTYIANHTLPDVDISPEDLMYARETELLTEMAVSQMSEQRKKIYRLSRNDGLTNDEIAKQLGISKKTVENQLSLTLKELRKIIAAFSLLLG